MCPTPVRSLGAAARGPPPRRLQGRGAARRRRDAPDISPTNSSPGRALSELPTTMAFLHSWGRVIERGTHRCCRRRRRPPSVLDCRRRVGVADAAVDLGNLADVALVVGAAAPRVVHHLPLEAALATWSEKSMAALPAPRTLREPTWARARSPRPLTPLLAPAVGRSPCPSWFLPRTGPPEHPGPLPH